jgi:hypothetical protein
MVGHRRIGWLVPRPAPAKPPLDRRDVIGAQLRKAEADVERLHGQLNELG